MLIVTNGDSAIGALRQAGLQGPFLAWADVLHEGPVPSGLRLQALSKLRAQFIASQGWAEPAATVRAFRRRDETLRSVRPDQETVLWFEHDLYDQLQLLQLLSWFGRRPRTLRPRLTLICEAEFVALSSSGTLRRRFQNRQPVRAEQLSLGRRGWTAFRRNEPWELVRLARSATPALPFLRPALERLIEEYPSVANGASRTEQQILETLASRPMTPSQIFRRTQKLEEAPFMGDLPFWTHLQRLASGERPLVETSAALPFSVPGPEERVSDIVLRLTRTGEQVLAGERDLVRVQGIDRWLGGVHLRTGRLWRREELQL